MNTARLFVLLIVLLPLLGGCGMDTLATPALSLEIRDARTGAPAAYGATVIARDGAYADTVQPSKYWSPETGHLAVLIGVAENRPGTYDVTITHPEYQTWSREGIRVPRSRDRSPFDGSPLPKQVYILVELQPRDGP